MQKIHRQIIVEQLQCSLLRQRKHFIPCITIFLHFRYTSHAIRECVERSIRTDSVIFTEHVTSAGGRRRFWQARTIPLGPDRALRMVIDMSEQLRWRQALERSEERFRQLVEQAVDGIFVCDEDGLLIDVNRQACESLGYSREELLSMNLVDICIGLDIEQLWELLDRLDPGQSETHAASSGYLPVKLAAMKFPVIVKNM